MSDPSQIHALLVDALSDMPELLVGDELNRHRVDERASAMDEALLTRLAANDELRARFFTTAGPYTVFNLEQFRAHIHVSSYMPQSYTSFSNRIGLALEREGFLRDRDDVVLAWPYKDCVLEGGQTKADARATERFLNPILDRGTLGRLLEPKVLTRWATHQNQKFLEEAPSLSSAPNVLIRGNNLVALHSIRGRFAGAVKMIYIDPPYYFRVTKPEDTFGYNSNFKFSSWLTFMRNRLEVARDLLSEDGAIFVQINEDGVAALELLMREIFCRDQENFINRITVRTKSPSGFQSVNPGLFETAEYILAFAKQKAAWTYKKQYVESPYDSNYRFIITNPTAPSDQWASAALAEVLATEQGASNSRDLIREIGQPAFDAMLASAALDRADHVYRLTAITGKAGKDTLVAKEKSRDQPDRVFTVPTSNGGSRHVLNGQEITFYAKKIRTIDGRDVPTMQATNIWTDVPYEGIASEGGVTLKGGKKPEKLLRRLIEMATEPGDIVLDYHLGSGTTAAVAHKLNRQWLGIEQLNYGDDDPTIRLDAVVAGDQTGISKAVNWSGGGSFFTADLGERAETMMRRIATSAEESLDALYDEIVELETLNYRLDARALKEHRHEFVEFSATEKRKLLTSLVDVNYLYVNFKDAEDPTMGIETRDRELTAEFYGESLA